MIKMITSESAQDRESTYRRAVCIEDAIDFAVCFRGKHA
jgi:hypothetical protein